MTSLILGSRMPLLEVSDLTIHHGKLCILNQLSFSQDSGEFLGLIGPSGCGKTLLAKSLIGLLPDRLRVNGSLLFQGETLEPTWKPHRKPFSAPISMIFQDPVSSLNPALTIGFQLKEAISIHTGLYLDECEGRALELLDMVRISDPAMRLKQYAFELSGGMCQRIMIAMALATNPLLLIADEPTTALDVIVQKQILDLIASLQKSLNMAVLCISHDVALLEKYCNRTLFLSDGRLYQKPWTQWLSTPPISLTKRTATGQDPCLLKVDQLQYKTYNQKTSIDVFQELHLELQQGQTLAIVGESGCGKTTLARCLLGLETPYSGSITFQGEPLALELKKRPLALQRKIQMIFQEPHRSMNPQQKIWQIVTEPLLIQDKLTAASRYDIAKSLLEEVYLPPYYLDCFPHMLSGGQAQRIALARALSADPSLILCDEPITALDRKAAQQILELLIEIQRTRGLSYIFISHDLHTVKEFAHDVAVMYLGNFVEYGPLESIFENPRHPYTQMLLEKMEVFASDPPSFMSRPKGCCFAKQCPFQEEVCLTRSPQVTEEAGHKVRCHFSTPIPTSLLIP